MKKEKQWIERKERAFLRDVLPLGTPFSMQVEPIRACNFKCIYCVYSVKSPAAGGIKTLPLPLFDKFINDFRAFPDKLKTLTFSGIGEPLLNKDLAGMVRLGRKISEKTVLITNGALLTPQRTDELIAAGLDTIRVSLQGASAAGYRRVCGFNLDFPKFLRNLAYLYKNRKQCEVFFKIPDIAVNTKTKSALLHKTFGGICDALIIQSISPTQNEVDYSAIGKNYRRTMYNHPVLRDVRVCPQPFYSMQLMADGTVRPCCMLESQCYTLGNVKDGSIYDIWRGGRLKALRRGQLMGLRNSFKACRNCAYPKYLDNDYDYIDDVAGSLLAKCGMR